MDIHQDLIKWLRSMGYNGEIPESLLGICNNSTKLVWEDLMQNVRPKQEVEIIKRNIILNRLKSKQIHKQDYFAYRIQEIEDFRHKLALEEKLKLIQNMIQEKQYKVEKLSRNCKMKDVSIDFLQKKIKENEERKHLLDLKKKQLQNQNTYAEETLTKLKNVTPVEREESSTAREVTETLEKCAVKLNNILTENQQLLAQNFRKTTTLHTATTTRKRHDQSSVATYLSIREKEDLDEITRSCVKKQRDKENIPCNVEGAKLDSKKRLFDVPRVIIEDTEKPSFERLSLNRCLRSDDQNGDYTDQISSRKPKKRESLGLLPDSCLKEENNDSFLHCSSRGFDNISQISNTNNVLDNSDDNIFSFVSNNERKSNNSSDSVIFNYHKNIQEKQSNRIQSGRVGEYYKKELYGDTYVNKELENLLHGNNREFIYEILQKLLQNIKVEFTKIVSMEGTLDDRKNMVNEDDITKLQFVHLQTELRIVHQKRVLKDLIAKIGRRKLQVLSIIKTKEDVTDLQDWLDINIKQVGLDASLAAMKKEINASRNVENDDNELQILSSQIMKVKNEIANKIKLINITIEDLYKTQKFLTSTRESVLSPIWHIRMFRTETDWMNPLLDNLWSEEIQVFDRFPVEYQRGCTFTDSKTYYRDLCTDNYPENIKIEPEHLQMLTEILENPFSPPETILLNILKAKMKLEVLKRIRNKNGKNISEQYCNKYSHEELQNQESYLEFSIDKLKAIMFSSNAHKTLSIGDVIKKTMEVWMEMPMKDFISDKRVVEGHNYQYYQNKLNTFL